MQGMLREINVTLLVDWIWEAVTVVKKEPVPETGETAAVSSLLTEGKYVTISITEKKSLFKFAKHVFFIALYSSLKSSWRNIWIDLKKKQLPFYVYVD